MRTKRPDLEFLGVAGLVLLLAVVLTWANYQFASQNPGGNDFVSRWMGTRLFLTQGLNPYSPETAQEIQEFIFGGRLARSGESLFLFIYPYYSMLVMLPFALIKDITFARAIWMTTFELSLLVIAFTSLGINKWRPQKFTLVLYLFFTMLWFHAVRPIVNGNLSVLVALFIALTFLAIVNGNDGAAGIMLAFTTIIPQVVILLVPFTLFWAFSKRKMTLINGFGVSMLVLVGGSLLSQPNWIILNLQQLVALPQYAPMVTPGKIFAAWSPRFGEQWGIYLSIFLSLILIREWLAAWKKNEQWFLWTAGITLVVTNLIGLQTSLSNYIAMFPALVLVFSVMEKRWEKPGRSFVNINLIILFVGLWGLFINTLGTEDQPIQNSAMFFPFPVYLFFSLYWIRHWLLSAPQFPGDRFKSWSNR